MTLSEPTLLPLALAQTAGLVRDTVATVAAPSTGLVWWLDVLTAIATIVIALALTLVSLAIIPAAWYARRFYRVVDQVLRRLGKETEPLVQHAQGALDNVHYVTAAVRSDVERLQRMIDAAQGRLEKSTVVAEHRIAEFNALLKVMQEEAEELFIGTASTVRGVRAGTARLQELQQPDDRWDDAHNPHP